MAGPNPSSLLMWSKHEDPQQAAVSSTAEQRTCPGQWQQGKTTGLYLVGSPGFQKKCTTRPVLHKLRDEKKWFLRTTENQGGGRNLSILEQKAINMTDFLQQNRGINPLGQGGKWLETVLFKKHLKWACPRTVRSTWDSHVPSFTAGMPVLSPQAFFSLPPRDHLPAASRALSTAEPAWSHQRCCWRGNFIKPGGIN